jgi:hypothetical protein
VKKEGSKEASVPKLCQTPGKETKDEKKALSTLQQRVDWEAFYYLCICLYWDRACIIQELLLVRSIS